MMVTLGAQQSVQVPLLNLVRIFVAFHANIISNAQMILCDYAICNGGYCKYIELVGINRLPFIVGFCATQEVKILT